MLNKWVGMGRMTKAPELRTTQNGKAVASFTIAVDRDFDRNKTDFISCTAWGRTAEFVTKYFTKGQLVAVVGELQSRDWTDRDGKKRTEWEIIVSNAYFAEGKKTADVQATEFEELADDVPLPF